MTRPGDDRDVDVDAIPGRVDADGGAAEERPQRSAAAAHLQDAGDLERGQPDHLAHDVAADGQLRAAHETCSRLGSRADSVAVPEAWSANASAMSSGTRFRAIFAATSIPKVTIRRRARPWVMITVPRTPRSGDPPARS